MNELSYLLIATNAITLGFAYAIFRSGAKQISELTSKLMARSLDEFSRNEVVAAPKPLPPNLIRQTPMQPIDEADPEEIMRALASETGRLNEYEREA